MIGISSDSKIGENESVNNLIESDKMDSNQLLDPNQSNYLIGPFDEGSTVTLQCFSSGGRPIPDVKWFNGSKQLRTKNSHILRDNALTVVSSTRFVVTRSDANAKLECRIWNNATDQPMSKWVSLDVHGKLNMSLRQRR